MNLDADITIEDLISVKPVAISFLREKGLICVVCGEPVWGSLRQLAEAAGYTPEEIHQLVLEINQL